MKYSKKLKLQYLNSLQISLHCKRQSCASKWKNFMGDWPTITHVSTVNEYLNSTPRKSKRRTQNHSCYKVFDYCVLRSFTIWSVTTWDILFWKKAISSNTIRFHLNLLLFMAHLLWCICTSRIIFWTRCPWHWILGNNEPSSCMLFGVMLGTFYSVGV